MGCSDFEWCVPLIGLKCSLAVSNNNEECVCELCIAQDTHTAHIKQSTKCAFQPQWWCVVCDDNAAHHSRHGQGPQNDLKLMTMMAMIRRISGDVVIIFFENGLKMANKHVMLYFPEKRPHGGGVQNATLPSPPFFSEPFPDLKDDAWQVRPIYF